MKLFSLLLACLIAALAQAHRPALLRVDPGQASRDLALNSFTKEFGTRKHHARKSKRSLFVDTFMSVPIADSLSYTFSTPTNSMVLNPSPTLPPSTATTPQVADENIGGESIIVPPSEEAPGIGQITEDTTNSAKSTDSAAGASPASGTLLIAVIAAAAATVLGAMLARKIYVGARSTGSSSNASSASSVVSSVNQPSVSGDMAEVPL